MLLAPFSTTLPPPPPNFFYFYYAPEGTSGGILKSNRPAVRLSVRPSVSQSVRPLQIVSQRYLINYWSKFDETSLKDKA